MCNTKNSDNSKIQALQELVDFCFSKETTCNIKFCPYGACLYIHLIKGAVNDETIFIYGSYSFEEGFFLGLDLRMELVAVFSKKDERVYLVNKGIFDIYSDTLDSDKKYFPDSLITFEQYATQCNDYLENNVFPEFISNLNVDKEYFEAVPKSEVVKQARKLILSNNNVYKPFCDTILSNQEVLNIIAGKYSLDEACINALENDCRCSKQKALSVTVNQYLSEHNDNVEDWELRLFKLLNSLETKFVNAEFEVNGAISTIKVDPKGLLRALENNHSIYNYSFNSYENYNKLLEELNVSDVYGKDISRITYRGREIYKSAMRS